MFKVLHTADIHASNKADKLREVSTCCDFMLAKAVEEKPDLIVLAGDTVDEYDGPIKIDSPAARYIIDLVQGFAEIAPVAIVRGTKSHDKDTPYLFRELKTDHPVYVAQQIEMVALVREYHGFSFRPIEEAAESDIAAALTFFPSPDKSHIVSRVGGEDIQAATMKANEILSDALAAIGEANKNLPRNVPKILIGHGMITGCVFSDCSSNGAVGEDFEFSPSDLAKAGCDLVCFGHIHKQQSFGKPTNIFYSGSPGRLSFGEQEEKGFLIHELDMEKMKLGTRNISTPARRFCFFDYDWKDGIEGYDKALIEFLKKEDLSGADIRVRIKVPEEERHLVNRDDLQADIETHGAARVKIEIAIIPKERQRAAGISQLDDLPSKIKRWGETVGEEIPERVLDIAATIEGDTVEELLADIDRRKTPVQTEDAA